MSLQRLVRILRQRARSLVRRGDLDRELDRELAFHLDALTDEYVADGLAPAEARRAARRAFGNTAALADRSRDERRVNWFHDGWQDVVHAWRLLGRDRVFTTVAMASLALGIGANAAVLSVIRAVQLDAVPFVRADRVVAVRATASNESGAAAVSLSEFVDWRTRNDVFADMGASINYAMDFGADEGGAPPDRIIGQAVTPGLFTTLGVAPLYGRWFTEAESRLDRPIPVVVLSYRLWQRRYGGDSEILTRRIKLDGTPMTIVGVMPQSFRYLDRRAEFWVPLRINRDRPDPAANFFVAARLKPGVTFDRARANLAALGLQPAAGSLSRAVRTGVRVDPMRDVMYGWASAPLATLEGAVALVLLIACANVASLLLARGSVRERELALRAALGAGRGRIARQLLTESALLAALAGGAGVVVAAISLRVLLASMSAPVGSPRLPDVPLDAWTIALTFGITLVALVCFAVAPSRAISRWRLSPSLKTSSHHGSAPALRSRTRLVTAQIALALVLLTGAGLLLNSFVRLADRDMHFETRGLLTFDYRVPGPHTSRIGTFRDVPYVEVAARPAEQFAAVYDRLTHVPGASAVAGISHPLVNSLIVPTAGVFNDARTPPDLPPDPAPPVMMYFFVTPHFFSTLRATLVAGRDIEDRDVSQAPWVAVVNETAAHRLWPGENAIGKRLALDVVPDEQPRDVIGVVRDMPIRTRQLDAQAVVYVSYLQQPSRYRGPNASIFGQMSFLVRAADGDAMRLMPAVRQAVAAIDPDRPLGNLSLVTEPGVPLLEMRNYTSSVAAFAMVATLLAAMGVYGVIATAVAQRTREIGIRRALGAGTRDIAGLVGRGALRSTLVGVTAGLGGSVMVSRLLASQLWGVTPTDTVTLATVSGLLLVVAALACLIPTRRALGVEPTTALRCE